MKTYESLLARGTSMLDSSGVPEADINARYLLSWSIAIAREEKKQRSTVTGTDEKTEDIDSSSGKPNTTSDDDYARFALVLAGQMPDRAWFLLHSKDEADAPTTGIYERLIGYRCKGCPLEYITHYTEFMGLPVYVDPSVLIPRQDTECLVEEALKYSEGRDALDLCTGSGCIAVSLGKLGNPGSVTATDKSVEALRVAGINASINDTDIRLLQGDLWKALDKDRAENKRYGLITCNPPYIRHDVIPTLMREVRDYEPVMALEGGEDGLVFYRKLAAKAGVFLTDNGIILMEIGYDQGDDVVEIFTEHRYRNIRVIKDLAGQDRVVKAEK